MELVFLSGYPAGKPLKGALALNMGGEKAELVFTVVFCCQSLKKHLLLYGGGKKMNAHSKEAAHISLKIFTGGIQMLQ